MLSTKDRQPRGCVVDALSQGRSQTLHPLSTLGNKSSPNLAGARKESYPVSERNTGNI